MTETPKLNRLVICLLYAACGLMRQVKRPRTACNDRFRRAAPLRLSTERRGCAQTVNWRRIRFIFESDRTASEAVGSVVYDEIQLKRTAQTINYIVGSVGNRRVGQLRRISL